MVVPTRVAPNEKPKPSARANVLRCQAHISVSFFATTAVAHHQHRLLTAVAHSLTSSVVTRTEGKFNNLRFDRYSTGLIRLFENKWVRRLVSN